MNDEDPPSGDDDSKKLIHIRGGKRVDPKDIGANFVLGEVGTVPTHEIIDPVLIDAEIKQRINYVKSQELVRSIEAKASTSEIIDHLLLEAAEELAHLKYERRKATQEGKNTSNYTIGRVNSLRGLADLLLKRKEASLAERLDLKSPRFQAVFQVWLNFFQESMEKAGVESDIIDLVFQQMKADMLGWEQKMDMGTIDAS